MGGGGGEGERPDSSSQQKTKTTATEKMQGSFLIEVKSRNCPSLFELSSLGLDTKSIRHLLHRQNRNFSCFTALGGSTYIEAGSTKFSKVRLDFSTMNLIPDDFHYSNTNSGKKIKYGEAGDCYSASKEHCRKGKFKIDLTGTGFRLKVSSNSVQVIL